MLFLSSDVFLCLGVGGEGLRLCLRVPFYMGGYGCYSFFSTDKAPGRRTSCIDTVVRRVRDCRRLSKRCRIRAVFLKKKAPSLLAPRRVRRVFSTVCRVFSMGRGTRVAVRVGPKAISVRGLYTVGTTNMGELDVKLRSTRGRRLGVLKEVRACRRFLRA